MYSINDVVTCWILWFKQKPRACDWVLYQTNDHTSYNIIFMMEKHIGVTSKKLRHYAVASGLQQAKKLLASAYEYDWTHFIQIFIETTAVQLEQLFEKVGEIEDATIVAFNGRSMGYGYVTMIDEQTAIKKKEENNTKPEVLSSEEESSSFSFSSSSSSDSSSSSSSESKDKKHQKKQKLTKDKQRKKYAPQTSANSDETIKQNKKEDKSKIDKKEQDDKNNQDNLSGDVTPPLLEAMIKCIASSTEEFNPKPINKEDSQTMEQTLLSFPDMEMFAQHCQVGEKVL
ncbi:MAG: hypothetical protein EZS28_042865 [Streblomastix strix]|uniref:RRM domain-containing protein n=1 Tax=Streblomastix strix TaxID=222440 RepID=A0A5J4TTU3_9EUKA|nr:MAG: hypothetical protein EZS28_042865 [Streblomastix strix]